MELGQAIDAVSDSSCRTSYKSARSFLRARHPRFGQWTPGAIARRIHDNDPVLGSFTGAYFRRM